jgi:RimJ/RimL family protein N-acetyltransferase
MTIRKTVLNDLPMLLSLYEGARERMRKGGNPTQWGETYPERKLLEQDIANKNSYVVEQNGKICGTFLFFIGADPTYAKIEGEWKNDRPYGVIHRIASDGVTHGVLKACVEFCKQQIDNLKIDTHADNLIMQHLLEKYGFVYCGIIHLSDGAPRLAYQFSPCPDEE